MKTQGSDVLAFVFAGGALLFSLVASFILQPKFVAMFADFGAELPWLTRLFSSRLALLAMGVLPSALVTVGLAASLRPSARLGLAVAAIAVSLVFVIGFIFAMYLPVFVIAGQVK